MFEKLTLAIVTAMGVVFIFSGIKFTNDKKRKECEYDIYDEDYRPYMNHILM